MTSIMEPGLIYQSPQKRKVLGSLNTGGNVESSPVSPTANLKLLTKVASQFCPLDNQLPVPKLFFQRTLSPANSSSCSDCTVNEKYNPTNIAYNRKGKSLGSLCERFLTLFPLNVTNGSHMMISLRKMAGILNVEKRRVYDIINIVESLEMATKFQKDKYIWYGNQNLGRTLDGLKNTALYLGWDEIVQSMQFELNIGFFVPEHEGTNSMKLTINNAPCIVPPTDKLKIFANNEKRISNLCQKFIIMFLVSHQKGVVNLELASKLLVASSEVQLNKSRMRRLYDIANVLVSLGLIRRLNHKEAPATTARKPAYVYCGPPLSQGAVSVESKQVTSKENEPGSMKEMMQVVSMELSRLKESGDTTSKYVETQPCAEVELETDPCIAEVEEILNSEPLVTKKLHFPLPLQITNGKNQIFIKAPSNSFRIIPKGSLTLKRPYSLIATSDRNVIKVESETKPVSRRFEKPQPSLGLKPGAIYKAVKVGDKMQLVRLTNPLESS